MPRLFTALEIPSLVAGELAMLRGGIVGARWIDSANFHITLRFVGDVDHATARDVAALLGETRDRAPPTVTLDALASFGGDRPRSLYARVSPSQDLLRLQAEQEKLVRRAGIEPEGRKFTPHVTLARLRNVRPGDVAAFIARAGHFPPLSFTATRFVLLSSRDSVGGGPYLTEAAYPFARQAGANPAPDPRASVVPAW